MPCMLIDLSVYKLLAHSHVKNDFSLAYHFSLCLCFCRAFLFAMITKYLDVSRCGNLWWSLCRWGCYNVV